MTAAADWAELKRFVTAFDEWRRGIDPDGDEVHAANCAVYDPVQHGPCDCEWERMIAARSHLAADDPR